MNSDTQNAQEHEHDYRPTKAGTYWKVCACGARKHFTSDTQNETRQFDHFGCDHDGCDGTITHGDTIGVGL